MAWLNRAIHKSRKAWNLDKILNDTGKKMPDYCHIDAKLGKKL